ncbi:MAG: zinc-binding dehydrogenase [Anaerolineales bacterium]|nr:MAG: zinc-binding dehydrogenase [Anaerolineales bacterium]
MRALVFYEHGGLDKLQIADVPQPEPGPGEALIEVRASALNHLDIWVRRGWPGLKLSMPHILGADGAGIVVALGEGVTGIEMGTRCAIDPGVNRYADHYTRRGLDSVSPGYYILGEHAPGFHAEYALVPVANLLPLPDEVGFISAAAASLVFLTAWRMLIHQGRIRAGETVLILGAGAGVNTAAIQIARFAGCTVYATTSSQAKMQNARDLGAEVVLNYHDDPQWSKTVYKLTGKRGVDVVVDNIGEATWGDSLRAVARGGRILTVGNTSGPIAPTDIRFIFGKQISVIGSTMGSHQDFRDVMSLVFNGTFQAVIDRVMPLEQGVEAIEILERGEQFGKIVLKP